MDFFYNGFCFIHCVIIFLFIPNIFFSSKLVSISWKDWKEEIRPSQIKGRSIFNIRPSDPHDRDAMYTKETKVYYQTHSLCAYYGIDALIYF